jgi:SAM-dependent methyltransferase
LQASSGGCSAPRFSSSSGFNAALVDHLNRDAAARARADQSLADLVSTMREGFEGLVRFESFSCSSSRRLRRSSTPKSVPFSTPSPSCEPSQGLRSGPRRRRSVRSSVLPTSSRAAGSTLRRRRRQAAPASPRMPQVRNSSNAYKYVGFEDRFRGSEDEIRARLEFYVPHFAGAADVLDIGCGRGEFLDLMRAQGIKARGLDLNGAMVEVCRERGLDAVQGDALEYLTSVPDDSLGGLIAVQVVEHLQPDYLMRLLETAFHKLRPGSTIALETINPTCWVAFFESYIRDLTHVRPVHPRRCNTCCWRAGSIAWRSRIARRWATSCRPSRRRAKAPAKRSTS